jgi:hypothetical protein
MLTRAQQILLKRAQAEAGIDDADYRAVLAVVSALPDCHSSTDRRLTDEHLDRLLAYFEAIYWRAVDAGEIVYSYAPGRVFRARQFWARKNTKGSNSRDRYNAESLQAQVASAEAELIALGYGLAYLQGIQNRVRCDQAEFKLIDYLAALRRTLRAKQGGRHE